jgi:hypothetical protein
VPSDGSVAITVADVKDNECLRGFEGVIAEPENLGYRVTLKHRYTQRGLPGWQRSVYDTASVTIG